MNDRQRRFVDEYILCMNASEAARRAGYSPRSAGSIGERLLKKAEIRTAIDKRLKAASSDKTLDQRALLEFLSAVVNGEVRDEQLMTRLIGKGCSVIERHEFRASIKDRIRAAELLLRVQGAFDKAEEQNDGSKLFVDTLTAIWSEHPEFH